MTSNQQTSFCVILYERSISFPTYSQLRRNKTLCLFNLPFWSADIPVTEGNGDVLAQPVESHLAVLCNCCFQAKPSPERILAETPLSHSPNLNPVLYLNKHRKESEDSMSPGKWGIIFSEVEGECQKIRLQVSTRMFSLRGGSAEVQALQIPRRWFQSRKALQQFLAPVVSVWEGFHNMSESQKLL